MHRGKRSSRQNLFSPRWALERLEERTMLSGNVVASVTTSGNLVVVGNGKGNEILVQSTSGGALQVSSLDGTTTINGGSGPFTATGFKGDVDVFMLQANSVVDLGGSGTVTSLPHSLFIGALNANDTVAVENASITGNVHIFGGIGSDTFTIGSTSTEAPVTIGGDVFIVGGMGNTNTIAVFEANIDGSLNISTSGVNDQVEVGFDAGLGIIGVEEPALVNIGINLNITTGDDPSFFTSCFSGGNFGFGNVLSCGLFGGFFSSSFCSIASWWGCETGGNSGGNEFAFSGGWCGSSGWCGSGGGSDPSTTSSGADVSLADVSVTGNVKIQTGNGQDQVLLGAAPAPAGNPIPLVFGPLTIGGKLNVTTGDGNDTLFLDGIAVTGNTTLKTGRGNDDIAVLGNDGSFTGTFTITTGAGNDSIAIINGATFFSSVTLNVGRGTNIMWLAQSDFMGSVTLNGDSGTNTLLESQSIFPNSFTPGNPVLNSIQTQMLNVSPTDPIVTTNFGWLNTLLGV
jgi:Ca2+-binding RTX toxin-like protein